MEKELKCKKCGGTQILADEVNTWTVNVSDEDKAVGFTGECAGGVEKIYCGSCQEPYELPDRYQWNFN